MFEDLSEEMREYFEVLDLHNFNRCPKMKEVKTAYFLKSKNLHPDKHMSENKQVQKEFEEKFKILHNAYTKVSNYIMEYFTSNEDTEKEDEEERLVKEEFENINLVKINQGSITLSIPKDHTKFWKEGLKENMGIART